MVDDKVLQRVKKEWEDNGECRSCGWHSSFYQVEYMIFPDILDKSNWNIERDYFHICCLNDYDDGDHRGSRLYGFDRLINGVEQQLTGE